MKMANIHKLQVVFVSFSVMIVATCFLAEAQSEVASPPLDANIVECMRDKVTLGLCVQNEMTKYITTRKLDFSTCCKVVDAITADCYPFVTTDPIFGLIYKQFCPAPAPAPPKTI